MVIETQGTIDSTSSPIAEIEFERMAKKPQEKSEKVKSRLLKIKVKVQGLKALVEEKFETNKERQEELLS